MKIGRILGLVCSLALLSGADTAQAGFDFAVRQGVNTDGTPVDMDGSAINTESANAPALQVFHEKYVPDDIKKQYHLSDDWYGRSATPESLVSPSSQPVAQPSPFPAQVVESWRARKGENLRDILHRWSYRGGANLMWAAENPPVLQKDFSFVGKFQDAVNAVIKEAGGNAIHSQYRSEGLSSMMTPMMAPAATITNNSPVNPAVEAQPAPQVPFMDGTRVDDKADPLPITPINADRVKDAPVNENMMFMGAFKKEKPEERRPETRWFGLSGAKLSEVIKVWAEDAGVQLVWQSEKNFALKESISQVGQFEDAVFEALNQYDGEPIRPVGEIYNDAASGQRVLIVKTDSRS